MHASFVVSLVTAGRCSIHPFIHPISSHLISSHLIHSSHPFSPEDQEIIQRKEVSIFPHPGLRLVSSHLVSSHLISSPIHSMVFPSNSKKQFFSLLSIPANRTRTMPKGPKQTSPESREKRVYCAPENATQVTNFAHSHPVHFPTKQ